MYKIGPSSPKAKERIKSYETSIPGTVNQHHRTKYPFDELNIGESFTIPFEEANEASLRLTATLKNKKDTSRRFSVLKHNDFGVIEVARIA